MGASEQPLRVDHRHRSGGGNTCTDPLSPCRTITHTLSQVNPALRTTIWLISNGGDFRDCPPGLGCETFPLLIPTNVTIRWSPSSIDPQATITYTGNSLPPIQSAILFDGSTAPAAGGIDGTKPGTSANGIRIVGGALQGLVNIRAAGTNSSAPKITRVTFDNDYRAIQIEENFGAGGGGTLSPTINACAFTGLRSINLPNSAAHIWIEATPPGVGAPSATIIPNISNCTFGVSVGTATFRGAIVMNVTRSPSAVPPWTAVVAPSISNCTIDGLDPSTMTASFTFGIVAQAGAFGLNGAAEFSPSVSGSTVMNCSEQGIRFWAQDADMVGTPVLSSTTVRDCGIGVACPAFPPVVASDAGQGNGATVVTGDFTTLSLSISDCDFDHNGCDGLGLYIRGGAVTVTEEPEFSATIGGSVVRCISRNNGDDGFELRARGFSQNQPSPLINATFNANRAHDNMGSGIEILTLDDAGAGGPTRPSITSVHTNELYYDNAAEGMKIHADLPLGGTGTLAPIGEWITCWSNGTTGVFYDPNVSVGTAGGTPSLWDSIIGMHGPLPFTDISLAFPVAGINFCNYVTGPTGTMGRTNIAPDFEVGVGNFHLAPTGNNYCDVIDYGAENPGCPVPPCVPVAVPFDFDGPTNPRVLDNPSAMCSTPLADRGVDERP